MLFSAIGLALITLAIIIIIIMNSDFLIFTAFH
jgi:hypothetical protein